jgi:hypothetical protein
MKAKRRKPKAKKIHATSDPTWSTITYPATPEHPSKSPFNIEWQKYYNPVEGRDQIVILYTDKENGKVVKYRILR